MSQIIGGGGSGGTPPASGIILDDFDVLTRTQGAATVVQVALSGRTDWTNLSAALGLTGDGLSAIIQSDLLAARAGRLELGFGAIPEGHKSGSKIQQVRLLWWSRQDGTVLSNGNAQYGYKIGAGADAQLFSTPDSYFHQGQSYDITAAIGNDFNKLDALAAYIQSSYAAAALLSHQIDAVARIITLVKP